jgi:hypothetical protein
VWTIRKQDINRVTACKIKFMQGTMAYTKWDQKRNDILNELKINPVIDSIQSYQE